MLLLCLAITTSPGPYPAESIPLDYWRNPLRCGANCLYGYLRLHGREVSLDEIASRVPITPDGANLADMRRAASELGISSRVLKANSSQLRDCPMPAIAHLDISRGHFVLLLQLSHDAVTFSDMTSGEIETQPIDLFLENWSGYLLIPDNSNKKSEYFILIPCLLAPLGFYLYRRRRTTSLKSGYST